MRYGLRTPLLVYHNSFALHSSVTGPGWLRCLKAGPQHGMALWTVYTWHLFTCLILVDWPPLWTFWYCNILTCELNLAIYARELHVSWTLPFMHMSWTWLLDAMDAIWIKNFILGNWHEVDTRVWVVTIWSCFPFAVFSLLFEVADKSLKVADRAIRGTRWRGGRFVTRGSGEGRTHPRHKMSL